LKKSQKGENLEGSCGSVIRGKQERRRSLLGGGEGKLKERGLIKRKYNAGGKS